jgi:hypothetical protein
MMRRTEWGNFICTLFFGRAPDAHPPQTGSSIGVALSATIFLPETHWKQKGFSLLPIAIGTLTHFKKNSCLFYRRARD